MNLAHTASPTSTASPTKNVMCPSVPHTWEGARIFAVVGGTVEAPELAYLDEALPVTEELVALTAPVQPDEVYRMAGACARERCAHHSGADDRCTLVERTVELTPTVVHLLPRCAIRTTCRWWDQEGASACSRCPQVATRNYGADDLSRQAATPPVAV